MERIGVLINKLQELYQQNAPSEQIIHVVQMLQTELFLLKQQQHTPERKKIAVMMPGGVSVSLPEQSSGNVNKDTLEERVDLITEPEDDMPAIVPPAKTDQKPGKPYRFRSLMCWRKCQPWPISHR